MKVMLVVFFWNLNKFLYYLFKYVVEVVSECFKEKNENNF